MTAGYEALRQGAGLLDFTARGRIVMKGEDRARLLHAMTTNHIQQLQPGQGCYAFFLNAQGRVLGDATVLCREDYLLLDVEPETAAKLFQHLDKYIIADDVALENANETMFSLGIEGPGSAALLEQIAAPTLKTDFDNNVWDEFLIARLSFTGQPGFRFYGPAQHQAKLSAQLIEAGAVPATPDDAHIVRIEQGKPRYGEDITETSLPQETQQAQALHFQKGCYLGQEIVERIRSRGHVNRILTTFEIEGPAVPTPGAKLMSSEKEAGQITSAAFSPALGKVRALGYARVEALNLSGQLQVNERLVRQIS